MEKTKSSTDPSQVRSFSWNATNQVRELDASKGRVLECQRRVNDLLDLQMCREGVAAAMEAEDFERAAGHVHRFLAIDESTLKMGTAGDAAQVGSTDQVSKRAASALEIHITRRHWLKFCRFHRDAGPDGEQFAVAAARGARPPVPHRDAPLRRRRPSRRRRLRGALLQGTKTTDEARLWRETRTFALQILPLIDLHDEGLQRFGRYLAAQVGDAAQKALHRALHTESADAKKRSAVLFADTLTLLLEGVARVIETYQPLVETYYGTAQRNPFWQTTLNISPLLFFFFFLRSGPADSSGTTPAGRVRFAGGQDPGRVPTRSPTGAPGATGRRVRRRVESHDAGRHRRRTVRPLSSLQPNSPNPPQLSHFAEPERVQYEQHVSGNN